MHNATRCRRLTLCVIMLMMMATGCPGNGKKETPRKATKKPAIHTPGKQDPTTDVDQKEEPGGSGGGGGFTPSYQPPPNPLDQQLNKRIEVVKKSEKSRINALETCLKAVFGITNDSKQITDCATIWAAIEDLTCDQGVFKVGIKRIKALRLFLNKKILGISISAKYKDYTCHPLHVAILRALSGTDAAKNYRSVIKLLLRAGDNIESVACKNDIKNTPLHLAVIFNASIETVELLLGESADVNADNNHDKTILMSAVQAGNPTIVQRLIQGNDKGKAEVNKAFGGSTPLSMALQTLLDSVKLEGSDGKTKTRDTYIKIANLLFAARAKDTGDAIEELANTSPIICTNTKGIKELSLDEKGWRQRQAEAAQKSKAEAAQKPKAEAAQKAKAEAEQKAEEKAGLLDMPQDVTGLIFENLSLRDKMSVSLVNKHFNRDVESHIEITEIKELRKIYKSEAKDYSAFFYKKDAKNAKAYAVRRLAKARPTNSVELIKHDFMRHYWKYLQKQNAETRKEILAKLPRSLLVYGHSKKDCIFEGELLIVKFVAETLDLSLWSKDGRTDVAIPAKVQADQNRGQCAIIDNKEEKTMSEAIERLEEQNIPFTDEELWRDKEFVLAMVRKYKAHSFLNVFQQADDSLKNDLQFVLEAYKIDRMVLGAATKRVRESIIEREGKQD